MVMRGETLRWKTGGVLLLAISLGFGCNATHEPSGDNPQAVAPVREGKTMHIRPRYVRLHTDPGVELAEVNYHYAELDWDVPISETAVVCIDCWSRFYSSDTWAREQDAMKNKITPLLEACRKHGMLVIHAPSDMVANRPANKSHVIPPVSAPQPGWPDSPVWPPAEFKSKIGLYAKYAKPKEPDDAFIYGPEFIKMDFNEYCKPVGDEPIIIEGEDLHRLCAQRHILHLFFIGYYTNACVTMRTYGLPAMVARGYDGILVRDCTTGMETADTAADMACTRGAIASFEQFLGYTVTSDQLIAALEGAR
jgi:nicotinamidase-related amidase